MADSLTDSTLGCVVGGAIGDAAGAAFEGDEADHSFSLLTSAEWRLTDDTQLTLATCEALCEQEGPDPAIIASSLLRWFRAGRLTGLGSSTLKALRDLDAGAHWALAGCRGDKAAGNGAAMRIAPLAFCLDPSLAESRRLIRDIARITHHHDEACIGALAVVLAVHAGKKAAFDLNEIASSLPDTSVRDRLLSFAALPRAASLAEAAKHGVSGFVVDSVPFALFAAIQVDRLGFAGMLEQVISAGGDTDTNASLAGQIAGTSLGLSGLPGDFLDRLPQAELVLRVARKFAERIAHVA